MIVFGDKEGKMSYLDLGTPDQLRNYAKHSISGGGCGNGVNGYSTDDEDDELYSDEEDEDEEPFS